MLGERSQANKYMKYVMGLYLYSTGASRQQIAVINHLGYSISYVTLAGRGRTTKALIGADGSGRNSRLGILDILSEAMRADTRLVASLGDFILVYDNINMVWKVAEQIIGRTGKETSAPHSLPTY